jgi:uncharacterized protein YcfL
MKTSIIILGLCLFFLSSCESKQEKQQTEMKSIVQEAEKVCKSGSDEEWKALETKFDKLESKYELERSSYSQEQRDSINVQIGEFRALQSKRLANDLKEDFNDLGKQVEGFIDGISN